MRNLIGRLFALSFVLQSLPATAQMSKHDRSVLSGICSCEVISEKHHRFRATQVIEDPTINFLFSDVALGILDRLGIPATRSSGSEVKVSVATDRVYFVNGTYPRHVGIVVAAQVLGAKLEGAYSPIAQALFQENGADIFFEWEFYYPPDGETTPTRRKYQFEISLASQNSTDTITIKINGEIETGALGGLPALDLKKKLNINENPILAFTIGRAKMSDLSIIITEDELFEVALKSFGLTNNQEELKRFAAILVGTKPSDMSGSVENARSVSAIGRFIERAIGGKGRLSTQAEAGDFAQVLGGINTILSVLSQVASKDFLRKTTNEKVRNIRAVVAVNGTNNGSDLEITFK